WLQAVEREIVARRPRRPATCACRELCCGQSPGGLRPPTPCPHEIWLFASGAHLATHRHVGLLSPPGTSRTHLLTALSVAARQHGHRVGFTTGIDWVTRLTPPVPWPPGLLATELTRLRRCAPIIGEGG